MKKLGIAVGALALGGAGLFGTHALVSGQGEGHTPVTVCHWVPAAPAGNHQIPGPDGGSYVVIVVDDDGASGNKKLHAHAGHEHDTIGDPDCGQRPD